MKRAGLRAVLPLAAVLFLVACGPDGNGAGTADFSGSDLLKRCDSTVATERLECDAYVSGMVDGLGLGRQVCIPGGSTLREDRDVVRRYLKDHSERLHEGRATLVYDSLRSAFPCQKP